MRRKGNLCYTLIAEQVFCTKLVAFSCASPSRSQLAGLYSKMFVSVNKLVGCLVGNKLAV
jgi:hypothetical protein